MTFRVVFSEQARLDLREIRTYIRNESSPRIAKRFADALVAFCQELATFPHRGTPRDEIRPGLRVIGFRGRVSVHFVVHKDEVRILAMRYAGRNWHADYNPEA